MAQAPKLQMKQILGLTLTPELKQSLEILQLGSRALSEFVQREIETNPVLDLDPDWRPPRGSDPLPQKSGPDISEVEGMVRTETTLADHLLNQIGFLAFSDSDTRLAGHIIGCLNKAGYLTNSKAEIAGQFGCTEAEVEGVLVRLQSLEPAGLFAGDLRECLALQLAEFGERGRDSLALLDHLEVLARGDLKMLERATGLSPERLGEAVRMLRRLDPKPGEPFATGDPVQTVIPDIFVHRIRDGQFNVELNPETLPRVLVNETYSTAFRRRVLKAKEKDFLQNCKRRAGWLKRALDQRAKTILKVGECLVAGQAGFFEDGLSHLRPMTMAKIAAAAGIHESTVSRVAANKYLSYAERIYPVRFFFSSGVGREDAGGGVSAHAIKEKIKALIGAEPKQKPLSDDKLAERLTSQGIPIARRTVMKYRESLKIPPSFVRRKKP